MVAPRFDRVIEFLASAKADILLLQEAGRTAGEPTILMLQRKSHGSCG